MTKSQPPALQLVNVTRTFGRLCAVRGVDLRIESGTSTAVMGANGAGKTTLLKLCATLLTPTSGSLRIAGFDPLEDGPAARARLAVVSHETHLYNDLSASENLAFAMKIRGMPATTGAIDAALQRVGLTASARRPLRTYSRGMQQRCALARLCLQRPEILLLDEPANGLDAAAKQTLAAIVREMHAAGTAVVLATHDVAEATSLCSDAVLMSGGTITWHGGIGPDSRDLTARLSDLAGG